MSLVALEQLQQSVLVDKRSTFPSGGLLKISICGPKALRFIIETVARRRPERAILHAIETSMRVCVAADLRYNFSGVGKGR